jgi:osmotically-inducible protein OsmY
MMMKMLFLLVRKPGEHGINIGLRLLALALSIVLFFLVTYYFLSVNRPLPTPDQVAKNASVNTERYKTDIALMGRIKAILGQSKRLHGYSIGVECKDGTVTISGEVPTQIDKELAAQLVLQTPGVSAVTNNLSIIPSANRTNLETAPSSLPINVEDFELEANLRERILSMRDLGNPIVTVKVKNKIVTLNGLVATAQVSAQIEQTIRNYPQVTDVTNRIKVTSR